MWEEREWEEGMGDERIDGGALCAGQVEWRAWESRCIGRETW